MEKLNIVVFSGSGISAESGIPTYRDDDGTWVKFDPMLYAVDGCLERDPEGVLNFYNHARKSMLTIEPNQAHKLLGELSQEHNVKVITQNVDNLHEKGGCKDVIHLHGDLAKVTSSRNPQDLSCIKEYPFDKAIAVGDKAEDGSQLRPYIVWFGESLNSEDLLRAQKWVESADVILVVGTSLQVYPAAGLVEYAPASASKYVIDPTDLTGKLPGGFKHIKDVATSGMQTFVDEVKNL